MWQASIIHLPLIMLHCYLIPASLRIMAMLLSGSCMCAHVYQTYDTERNADSVQQNDLSMSRNQMCETKTRSVQRSSTLKVCYLSISHLSCATVTHTVSVSSTQTWLSYWWCLLNKPSGPDTQPFCALSSILCLTRQVWDIHSPLRMERRTKEAVHRGRGW